MIKILIQQLIDAAAEEGDINTQIIMTVLASAKNLNQDDLFAAVSQDFTKDFLLPYAEKIKAMEIVSPKP